MSTEHRPATQRFTAKGRATRERILQSAAEVLLTEGLSGLNMDKVRTVASVSGSQLTHYYAEKQALIRAIVTRQIGIVLDFHRKPRLGGLGTFDDFEAWIERHARDLTRLEALEREIEAAPAPDLAMLTVATRTLRGFLAS